MESANFPAVDGTAGISKSANGKKLTDYSAKDAPWDSHRADADAIAMMYAGNDDFKRLAERISECSQYLSFGMPFDKDTGEIVFKLKNTSFCRVRYCVVCQWRRSLMNMARFYKSIPAIEERYPKHRWIFLTLTVRNPEITQLRAELDVMGKAWHRLIKRKEFAAVEGWIRTTEVTYGASGTAHPHFHALLMVPPSWFTGKRYVKQHRWCEMWMECLRVDYLPSVNVKAVKARVPESGTDSPLFGAVKEVLKYSVKPADMFQDEHWFLELTRQTHKLRFIASGGALKDILKDVEASNDDLMLNDEPASSEDDGARLAFNWRPSGAEYRRFPRGDKTAEQANS
jgi:plasmid rolling circle replication initiator protein Rep